MITIILWICTGIVCSSLLSFIFMNILALFATHKGDTFIETFNENWDSVFWIIALLPVLWIYFLVVSIYFIFKEFFEKAKEHKVMKEKQ